jgi:hypothetical protein
MKPRSLASILALLRIVVGQRRRELHGLLPEDPGHMRMERWKRRFRLSVRERGL